MEHNNDRQLVHDPSAMGGTTGALARIRKSKPVSVAANREKVVSKLFSDRQSYPLVYEPSGAEIDFFAWLNRNQSAISENLHTYGALLFRGFNIDNANLFERFLISISGDILEYTQRSSPRHEVHRHIYTSTDHPSDQHINMHCEHSYSHEWPLKISFCCTTPSPIGGETPIADTRVLLDRLTPSTVKKFLEKDILYVRNLGTGMGMGWKKVFQTEDKEKVKEYCEKYHVKYEWYGEEKLRLEFVRPAIRQHPVTGKFSWFNHAYFFNILSLENSLRESLEANAGKDLLPFLTYYGDGSPIEAAVIDEIKSLYRDLTNTFRWEKGDVLLLDNMSMAHGRMPFEGERQILVGMLEAIPMNN